MYSAQHRSKKTLRTQRVQKEAELSKHTDVSDWERSGAFFQLSTFYVKKVRRFNSKFYCPGIEEVDAFWKLWKKENNLMVPPVKLIRKALKHLLHKAVGTLLIPVQKSSSFWSMFKEEKFSWINKDNITINKGKDVLQPGHCTLSLLG